MPQAAYASRSADKSGLERALTLFTDIRAGEGATAVLMLINIFLLLVCYSVIKTVREPLILLGGGAEVRSYAAAGQALLLMGFVPVYSWFASRVDRVKLLVGVTLFFVVCIELFAAAVAARVPYVGVAFFIWVGIFNISLVAQFWSFANDLYDKEAGDRLFPIIVMGMTAGAPLGSLIAARLFGLGIPPQVILQVSAVLLSASLLLYLCINTREAERNGTPEAALPAGGGFRLVINNRYLRLVALLVVLLNVVNTMGEYLVARLLTSHVHELAMADPAFDKQAFIGAFSGDYQFWVNITALLLQAFVTSRLVKYKGIQGALLALPLIALGGYAIIAAGVGFSLVRWIKTAENATDYSIMNTARQLLWLPTNREEKYKAKQAIDTFFVRTGDLLSAAAVFLGTGILHLKVEQFAVGNIVLTLVWLGVALIILRPQRVVAWPAHRGFATAAAALTVVLLAAPAFAQQSRDEHLAAQRAQKAADLYPYEPTPLERRIERLERALFTPRSVYPFMGSALEGGGLALGPGYRARYGDTGTFNAHAAWSVRNYKVADAALTLPTSGKGRIKVALQANRLDAPSVAFYGVGNESRKNDRGSFLYRTTTVGASTRVQAAPFVAVGGGLAYIGLEAGPTATDSSVAALNPTYRRSSVFAEIDWRTSPLYSRRGGFYRIGWSDYRQTNAGSHSFRRLDAEVQQFVPLLRENWVIALRAAASSTDSSSGDDVPYVLMPQLGGTHMLRGYPSWRFRDRNRLLFTGEYRWTAGPFVDMALFVDAGKVAGRRADLNLRHLHTSHGLGLSLHTPNATIARVEVARSREGVSVTLSFSPSFCNDFSMCGKPQRSASKDGNMRTNTRARFFVGLGSTLAVTATLTMFGSAASPKFFHDDPVWVERDTEDAAGMTPLEVNLVVDLTYNVLAGRGEAANVRAKNLNTVDEVPSSSWFTNRSGHRPLTSADISRGPNTTDGPAPGSWTVTSSKSDGVTPGFTVKDANGQRWFLKFDPRGHRGMATGTEVAVTKLMWALGYHVPENHIAYLHREQLIVGSGAKFTPVGGKERALRITDIDHLLERADRERDGSYRIVASKALQGTPVGRVRFYDTRPDDPNDIVPHEHRRELRGYGVFAAWLNHVDAKAINSLDMLVTENGRSFVRHNLIDFGSSLGSGGIAPADYWAGSQYLIQPREIGKQMMGLGFSFPKWHTTPFYGARSIGRLPKDNTSFNPDLWRPRVPNQAFLHARADDKFWAAQRLVALTTDLLRAAVHAGEFRDPTSEELLVRALAERRDAIARAYLAAINPLADPALDGDGILTFRNAAVDADVARAPHAYRAIWSTFDNATGEATRIAETTSRTTQFEAPAGLPSSLSAFVKVELSAFGGLHPSWTKPVHAYFQRLEDTWRLVGFERMPEQL